MTRRKHESQQWEFKQAFPTCEPEYDDKLKENPPKEVLLVSFFVILRSGWIAQSAQIIHLAKLQQKPAEAGGGTGEVNVMKEIVDCFNLL